MQLGKTAQIFGILLMAGGQMVQADVKKSSTGSGLTPEVQFTKTVQPFLSSYCVGCHNAKTKAANLDLQQFDSAQSVRANLKVWKKVAWRLQVGEMPPPKTPQPKAAAQKAVLKWVTAELATAAPAK